MLAYLLGTPGKDTSWLSLVFAWVLLTIFADELAGWFGYIALALGVLPLLVHTPPEQWYVVLPLVGGALFALLIIKHSGGPFVLPFGAALFAGTLLGAAKVGAKLDPNLKLVSQPDFQKMALTAMLIGVGFSFLRQLISMLVRWQQRRKLAAAAAKASASQKVLVPEKTVLGGSEDILITPPAGLAAEPDRAEPDRADSEEESVTLLPSTPPTVEVVEGAPVEAGKAEAAAPLVDMDLSEPRKE